MWRLYIYVTREIPTTVDGSNWNVRMMKRNNNNIHNISPIAGQMAYSVCNIDQHCCCGRHLANPQNDCDNTRKKKKNYISEGNNIQTHQQRVTQQYSFRMVAVNKWTNKTVAKPQQYKKVLNMYSPITFYI